MVKDLIVSLDTLIRNVSLNELRGLSPTGKQILLERLREAKHILQQATGGH